MAKTNRRKRHRLLALSAAGAVGLVVVLVVAIVVVVLRRPDTPSTAIPPSAAGNCTGLNGSSCTEDSHVPGIEIS